MNDLEFAAKAAGLKVHEVCDEHLWISIPSEIEVGHEQLVIWSPRTDDGDALRLAAGLRLCVFFESGCVRIGPRLDFPEIFVHEGEDYMTVARHAIFRTAVQIGKSLQEQPQ